MHRSQGTGSGVRRSGSDLGSRVDVLHGRLASLELEVKDLRREVTTLRDGRSSAPPAPGSGSARRDGLTGREAEMMQEIELLRGEIVMLRADGATPGGGGEVEELQRRNRQLIAEIERIEGEHQALKLRLEGATEAMANLDISDVPINEETVRELLALNQRLEAELGQTRKTATTRIKRLKSETSTLRTQKENLLKALAERDAGVASDEGELTLEQITDSEVFKTMLGNIRRTSREEVTLLHTAIASLRKIDPAAYSTALTVIAKQFEKANVENPLATLPRD